MRACMLSFVFAAIDAVKHRLGVHSLALTEETTIKIDVERGKRLLGVGIMHGQYPRSTGTNALPVNM